MSEDQLDPRSPPAVMPLLELTKAALAGLEQGTITVSDSSRSMLPLLRGGELLHWRRMARPAEPGELLIYVQKPGPIVHRVIDARAAGGWITKGDGRGGFDVQPVLPDEAIGVVTAIERGGVRITLEQPGAKRYAACARAVSQVGGISYRVAERLDGLLRRLLRQQTAPRCFVVLSWWGQRGLQQVLYRLLFRLCHRAESQR